MSLIWFELWFRLWFRYGLGYDFDMVLIWFGNGAAFSGTFQGSRWVGLEKQKQKQPRDRLLVNFSRVFMVLILF